MAISTEYGQSPLWFGHADYDENRKKGYTSQQVLEWMDQNLDKLRGRNTPGSGGLYDTVKKDVEATKPAVGSSNDDYFDLGKFEQLLGKLEDSKQRQQRQKSVERRRDMMAVGEAGMMSNF